MDKKKLGLKVKLARTELGLNQAEFARKIGATQKSISRYETGDSLPTLGTLVKIAEALNKPTSFFLD